MGWIYPEGLKAKAVELSRVDDTSAYPEVAAAWAAEVDTRARHRPTVTG